MAASFGAVSGLGLLSNLVLVPVTDAALVSGLIALAAECAWAPLARPFWTVADAAALATLRGANLIARSPAALKPLGHPPWALAALGVGLAALLLARAASAAQHGRIAVRVAFVLAVGAGLAGAAAILVPRPAPREHALVWTLFDVGQGDGMLLRFPDGRALVIDGGMADPAFDQGARVVVPALRARGVYALDAVLATHRDLDHLGGLPAVVRDVPCRWVAGPGDVPGRILTPVRKRGGAAGPARPFEVLRGQRVLEGPGLPPDLPVAAAGVPAGSALDSQPGIGRAPARAVGGGYAAGPPDGRCRHIGRAGVAQGRAQALRPDQSRASRLADVERRGVPRRRPAARGAGVRRARQPLRSPAPGRARALRPAGHRLAEHGGGGSARRRARDGGGRSLARVHRSRAWSAPDRACHARAARGNLRHP